MGYEELKQYLSYDDKRLVREGNNPLGRTYSRQQLLNIMKLKTKNFIIRNHLVEIAEKNKRLSGH